MSEMDKTSYTEERVGALRKQLALEQLSFEEGLRELNALTEFMSRNRLELEEAVKFYQLGTDLLQYTERKLEQASAKIAQLMGGEDGLQEATFEPQK